MTTINMQTMRYINLLDSASHVKTRKCFVYNNIIFFAVPRKFMSRAIGPDASNIRRIQEKLGKKVRIIEEVEDSRDAKEFVEDIVNPVKFRSFEVDGTEATITAGNNQSKAILIGRNRRRFDELKQIINDIFGLDLKIV